MTRLQAEFTKYMKIALKNDSIDYFRMQNRKNNIESISYEEIDNLEALKSLDSGFDAFYFTKNNLLECISNKSLYLGIKSLTKRQQEIIFLYAQGYSLAEISQELSISNGTVKATIFQVKTKLKKYIEGV